MRIEARDLSLSIGGAALLSEVSLLVQPGEKLALVGPNGAGKSSMLRLLAGVSRPSAGEVMLDGDPIGTLSRRQTAQRIAMLAQQEDTEDRLRVRDAVELGRTPWLGPLSRFSEADARIVEESMSRAHISTLADRFWQTLSGGERQRAHLARALAQTPRALLLDEPANHLDIRHQLSLLALISGLKLTVIAAVHDLNQAMGFDRVGVLERGRLVALGPPEQILAPPLLRSVFGVEARSLPDPAGGTALHFSLPQTGDDR